MVAPRTTPPPPSLDVAVAIGDDRQERWCSDIAENRTSRTLTTQSSPCDVSDDEQNEHTDRPHDRLVDTPPARPLYPSSSSKPVADEASDYYCSAETPRSQAPNHNGSFRSIQIQIESIHNPRSSDAQPPSSHAGGAEGMGGAGAGARRRGLCGRLDVTTAATKRPLSFQEKCCAVLLPTVMIIAPPTLVLLLMHFSVTYVMLFVLNVVVACASWEWSWWSFRIRRRLLLPFHHANETPARTHDDRHVSIEDLQNAVLNEPALAIDKITKRWTTTKTIKYLVAAAIALIVSAIAVPVVYVWTHSAFLEKSLTIGKDVLLGCSSTAIFSAVFCACLSPVAADAFIVCVYVTCFLVASLNSFLSNQDKAVRDPELLDSMYVLLVGACAIVVWRIVSSKEVMESTIMAMLDILGLAYMVAPMMSMADFLGHPNVGHFNDIIGTFFVVVSAAEAAYQLNELLKQRFPWCLANWRRPVTKHIANSLGMESLVLSVLFGIVGSILTVLVFHGYIIYWQDGLVYFGVIVMSQFCRVALDAMKTMAKVDAVTYQPWLAGFMSLLNPYLLAMVVFHPYVKGMMKSTG